MIETSYPNRFRSSLRTTWGGIRDTTYEALDTRYPGHGSSVAAAPPTTPRFSRTSTFKPALARYAAHARPLWPPPMMTTSRSNTPTEAGGYRARDVPRNGGPRGPVLGNRGVPATVLTA